jgi:hypothetical protein
MGRENDALADLARAIELDPSLDWAVTSHDQVRNTIVRPESEQRGTEDHVAEALLFR